MDHSSLPYSGICSSTFWLGILGQHRNVYHLPADRKRQSKFSTPGERSEGFNDVDCFVGQDRLVSHRQAPFILRCSVPKTVSSFMKCILSLCLCLICSIGGPHSKTLADESFSGKKSDWNGFARYDFEIDGRPVLVVTPKTAAKGKPWVWHGEFFGHKPAPDIALLGKGFHIVYTQISNQFGSPAAVAHWNQVYRVLTEQHGFAKKAALVGVSRGGLYCYNWASQNPDKVACIYGDAPVCDVKSWPMGKGHGVGSPNEVKNLLAAYDAKTEEELFAKLLNPIDTLKPLAAAHVPLLHVYGDADEVVPWDENTKIIAERYKELGGEMILISKPGIGHVHGLDDSTPLIEFMETHCLRAINAEPIKK
jgi:pimeloyl-ACP methyl ester carboxylesterase